MAELKPSLKTFPNWREFEDTEDFADKVLMWKKRFEGELRQRKQSIEEQRQKDVMFEPDVTEFLAGEDNRGDIYCRGKEDGELEAIKKVFGGCLMVFGSRTAVLKGENAETHDKVSCAPNAKMPAYAGRSLSSQPLKEAEQ